MIKVITYGTYDLLHYGHIRLLERAKKLGDYLIVGVTADDFDKTRGKINVQQSLMERIEAVRETGLADEIIVEEYMISGDMILIFLQSVLIGKANLIISMNIAKWFILIELKVFQVLKFVKRNARFALDLPVIPLS